MIVAAPENQFQIGYDKLVIAVGAYSQSKNAPFYNLAFLINNFMLFVIAFNIPGVKEHAYFLKDVRDARAIRLRILECKYKFICYQLTYKMITYLIGSIFTGFEQASQPLISDDERRRLLNFCIVGMFSNYFLHFSS